MREFRVRDSWHNISTNSKLVSRLPKWTQLIPLGKSDVYVSSLGLGAWSWGDRLIWSYGGHIRTILDAFHFSLDAGINFIDTADHMVPVARA
jgi:hypothetical protein